MKEIIKFNPSDFLKIAEKTTKRVQFDAMKGIFQDGQPNQQYSERYKKYKANSMEGLKSKKKLKAFRGKSTNTETNFVNLTLTGEMWKRFTANRTKTTANSIVMSYHPDVSGRVLGAKDLGRDITTLNKDNEDFVLNEIGNLIDINVRNWAREKITITVGT